MKRGLFYRTQNSNFGNGMLEFLLYTPVLLLLVFGVTDAGFVYTEKVALVDNLRSSLNSSAHFIKTNPLLKIQQDSSVVVDQQNADYLVRELAELVLKNFTHTLASLPSSSEPNYTINIALLKLDADTSSPENLANFSTSSLLSVATLSSSNPVFNIKNAIPNFSYIPMDNFINNSIRENSSLYSHIIGVGQQTAHIEDTFLLYGEVSTLARGINQSYAKSALGQFYGLQEQLLLPVRGKAK
jgi:hypothetical protein